MLQRRRLGVELNRLRVESEMTLEAVARELGTTRSRLSRIENGKHSINAKDLSALIELYGVSTHERKDLEQYVRGTGRDRERNWWSRYNEDLTAGYSDFIAFEAEATVETEYQPLLVPGLLQTPEYAVATHGSGFYAFGRDRIEALVDVRRHRQKRLISANPLTLRAFVTEAALRSQIGGHEVWRGQLAHLVEQAELPTVELRIVPLTAPGTYSSGATLLDFEDQGDLSVAFLDAIGGSLFRDDDRDLRRLRRVFQQLDEWALAPEAGVALINQIREEPA
ncbi:helix-turn-helix transcriptional regulator [Yinghuangia sp. ASG 101]|uniref:helix-turn-helix domain-containing protein n=1 Tax=Yinghuangia sp. ASG 101 TaxID=2896848 RepID=UPI001E5087AF|nr:helix-turn-helix transcriptional regulator [Yinghuangia sp. ASG 101]UGQ10509.1 helix-turn-helix transcriptional regulator [Yinghuangia sp. ASG 101]